MSSLFRNIGGEFCTASSERSLEQLFTNWPGIKESAIEQGVCCPDHVHMLISIPPKFAVSSVIGYIKGKRAIHVARHFLGKARNYIGQSLWARGFFVSTAGVNDEIIREYIRHQEEDDRRIELLELFQQKSSPYEDVNEPQ